MLEIWKDEFDSLAAEGRMINFVLHPQFIGRASRVNMLSELIGYMLSHGGWIDTNRGMKDRDRAYLWQWRSMCWKTGIY